MCKKLYIVPSIIVLIFVYAKVDADALIVKPMATLVVAQEFQANHGDVLVEEGGRVIGKTVVCNHSLFDDAYGNFVLTGEFKPHGLLIKQENEIVPFNMGNTTIVLQGHHTITLKKRTLRYPVFVRGENNCIEGYGACAAPITLFDRESYLIWSGYQPLQSVLQLGNGNLFLRTDLVMSPQGSIQGSGVLQSDGCSVYPSENQKQWSSELAFVGDIHCDLSAPHTIIKKAWRCRGTCHLQAHDGIVEFEQEGKIYVEDGATLFLSHMHIKGMKHDTIELGGPCATVEFSHVTLEMATSITTSEGTVKIAGPTTIVSNKNSWYLGPSVKMFVEDVLTHKELKTPLICLGTEKDTLVLSEHGHIGRVHDVVTMSDASHNFADGTVIVQDCMFDATLFPVAGETKIYTFCTKQNNKPILTCSAAVLGSDVVLPHDAIYIFRGPGIVRMTGSMLLCGHNTHFIFEQGATLHYDDGAHVIWTTDTVRSAGTGVTITVRDGGRILIDTAAHMQCGQIENDVTILDVQDGGSIILDHKDAQLSCVYGTCDLLVTRGIIWVCKGILSCNLLSDQWCPGHLRLLQLTHGGKIKIDRDGAFFMARNAYVSDAEQMVTCDLMDGTVSGKGSIALYNVDTQQWSLSVVPASALFSDSVSMHHLFSLLCTAGALVPRAHVHLSTQDGVELRDALCLKNGHVVPLLPGDHDLFCDSQTVRGPCDVFRGYDARNCLFMITSDGVRHAAIKRNH